MDSDVRSKVMKRDTLYMSYITVRSAKHAKAVVGFGGNLPPLPIGEGWCRYCVLTLATL